MRQRHQVRRSEDIQAAIDSAPGNTPDLVLINQAHDNGSGWQHFDCLEHAAQDLPAMVYVLASQTTRNVDWIAKAVDAAIQETRPEKKSIHRIQEMEAPLLDFRDVVHHKGNHAHF
jgi:hypothetical protein